MDPLNSVHAVDQVQCLHRFGVVPPVEPSHIDQNNGTAPIIKGTQPDSQLPNSRNSRMDQNNTNISSCIPPIISISDPINTVRFLPSPSVSEKEMALPQIHPICMVAPSSYTHIVLNVRLVPRLAVAGSGPCYHYA
eukprot:gene22282-biopygen7897